jgi:hypothetical protein
MSNLNQAIHNISLTNVSNTATIDSNLLNRHYKLEQVLIFNEIRKNNPHLNQKDIAAQMGTSVTSLQRIRKDLAMKSPYRYDIATRKKPKDLTNDSVPSGSIKNNKWHCDNCNKDMMEKSKESHLKSKTHLQIVSSKPKHQTAIGGEDEVIDEYLNKLKLPITEIVPKKLRLLDQKTKNVIDNEEMYRIDPDNVD